MQVESYHKLEKLGEGTYATVYKGLSMYVERLMPKFRPGFLFKESPNGYFVHESSIIFIEPEWAKQTEQQTPR